MVPSTRMRSDADSHSESWAAPAPTAAVAAAERSLVQRGRRSSAVALYRRGVPYARTRPLALLAWVAACRLATTSLHLLPLATVNAVPLESTQAQFLADCQAAWRLTLFWRSGPRPDCSSILGVTCDESGMIVSLMLLFENLGGPIPQSISNLRNLSMLAL
ncbi:hypothetical protein CLOP_g12538 [Closterium sp. NIES-67]|nr:hypothetical protein CLOP_g12538 [Closterium sp. NIES-67]